MNLTDELLIQQTNINNDKKKNPAVKNVAQTQVVDVSATEYEKKQRLWLPNIFNTLMYSVSPTQALIPDSQVIIGT